MATIPSVLGTLYARNVLKKYHDKAVTPEIANTDYEAEFKAGGGSSMKILEFLNNVTLNNYTASSTMTTERWMGGNENTFSIDQQKYWNFAIDDVNRFEAYVKDIDSNLLANAAAMLQETIDSYVLGLYTNARVGNRVGSEFTNIDYEIGGASVTAATGAVELQNAGGTAGFRSPLTAVSTDSTSGSALVGIGISFDTGATWFKITTYTDSDSIVISNWNDSTYSGGAQDTGASFIIEALYPKLVTSSTIYADIVTLGENLDDDKIPAENRYLVVPPAISAILKQATELIPAVATAYENVVLNGLIGTVGGFKVHMSNQVTGSASKGWRCVAGHKSFITFAHAFMKSRVLELEGTFETAYQGLHVYGAAVPVERRKAGALAFWITSGFGSGDDWTA